MVGGLSLSFELGIVRKSSWLLDGNALVMVSVWDVLFNDRSKSGLLFLSFWNLEQLSLGDSLIKDFSSSDFTSSHSLLNFLVLHILVMLFLKSRKLLGLGDSLVENFVSSGFAGSQPLFDRLLLLSSFHSFFEFSGVEMLEDNVVLSGVLLHNLLLVKFDSLELSVVDSDAL